ncbi:MAG: PorP/SprF family type IX secretion system membrane protein [Bacteroidales bacterium]|nr:PorP/SprF family type IX secretion system membrane protein [Bacteroidales bacterium]
MIRNTLYIIIVLLAMLVCSFSCFGQDIHFTQYYATPLVFNPASTGLFDEDIRLSNNYRTQWSAVGVPYQTVSVSVDAPFRFRGKSGLGVGFMFLHDKSGGTKLTANKFMLSLSYLLKINKRNLLSLGLQGGYVNKYFTLDGITLPSQYNPDTGLFDVDLPNNVTDMDMSLGYFDMHAGVAYCGKFQKVEPIVGISVLHLNAPQETYCNTNSKLTPRMLLSGGVRILCNGFWSVTPHLLTTFNKKTEEMLFGALAERAIPTKVITSVFFGASARTSFSNIDATMLTAGLTFYGITVGASYDINLSKLMQATNARGAFEISLIYKLKFEKKNYITLPCDRF